MFRAFPIGRVFGIRLDVQTSWLPIYALVTATIANVGPIAALGPIAAYTVAGAAAVALFASIVVHELAHALTARRFGVRTSSISLFLFGGVATLESEPPTPGADALVALAGPAASVLIALAAYGLMHAVDLVVPARFADAAASLLAYVTFANGVLAGFNLIPAYPLDGGRVLRSLLWAMRDDRDGATVSAALVGIAFGMAFALAGIVAAVATRTWQFAWYVAVAAFVVRTCFVQYRALRRPAAVTSRPRPLSGAVSAAIRTANQPSG
jgi:Zn-dependent protease